MNKGTVKWFNSQKGYGFISDEQGNDIFVHFSGLAMDGYKTLEDGQSVFPSKLQKALVDYRLLT